MSKGTCCSASHRLSSRASASFMRSIWIFLTMTSRPPTAVTTDSRLTPAASNKPRIASETRPGSTTSPSTIALAATSVVATLLNSGSLPPWSMTTSLMMPEPISRPTEVFLPPRKPKRAICTFWSRDKKGRRANYHRPRPLSCQASNLLEARAINCCPCRYLGRLKQLRPTPRSHHRNGACGLQSRENSAAGEVQGRLTAQALRREVGVLRHDATPEVGVGISTAGRFQVALDHND